MAGERSVGGGVFGRRGGGAFVSVCLRGGINLSAWRWRRRPIVANERPRRPSGSDRQRLVSPTGWHSLWRATLPCSSGQRTTMSNSVQLCPTRAISLISAFRTGRYSTLETPSPGPDLYDSQSPGCAKSGTILLIHSLFVKKAAAVAKKNYSFGHAPYILRTRITTTHNALSSKSKLAHKIKQEASKTKKSHMTSSG